MGSSASKATSSTARRLPTSTQSSLPKLPPTRQTPPPLSGRQVNNQDAELDETYSRHRDLRGNAPQRPSPLNAAAEPKGPGGLGKGEEEAGRSAALDYGLADQGARPGTTGRANAGFSGEKDDAVLRDAQDPQFMANLSRLGQVQIHDAGKFVKAPALAQRTLSARSPLLSTPTQIPPKGHLTAPLLINLLDRLKTLPANGATTSKAVQDLYAQFNMSKDSMDVLRRYVNSPSVGEDVVRVEEGERIVEMRAVWVDGAGAGAERETERIA